MEFLRGCKLLLNYEELSVAAVEGVRGKVLRRLKRNRQRPQVSRLGVGYFHAAADPQVK
jgi:hypothetical protein